MTGDGSTSTTIMLCTSRSQQWWGSLPPGSGVRPDGRWVSVPNLITQWRSHWFLLGPNLQVTEVCVAMGKAQSAGLCADEATAYSLAHCSESPWQPGSDRSGLRSADTSAWLCSRHCRLYLQIHHLRTQLPSLYIGGR